MLGAAVQAVVVGLAADGRAATSPPKPNIIQILVDDLGWGDVGFNGQAKIKTPSIDALASSGMVMRNGYCPASVCAPTRAALLTGFHSGHTYIDRNNGGGDAVTGWRLEDVTLAEVLKPAGYTTAAIGKWGFGGSDFSASSDFVETPNSLPNKQGYDSFYGYLNHARAQDYFSPTLWRTNASASNGVETVATGGVFTHDLFEQQALQYVAQHAASSQRQPFYLHLAPTIPHFDLDAIAKVPNWDSQYTGSQYASWTDKEKKYAAMVTRMDATIGRLMAKLDDPNGDGSTADSIAANTIVTFASDNGPSFEDGAPWWFFDSNGPYRGGKIDLQEGGIRTPLVVRWKDHIAAGATSDRVTDLSDFLPTFADLAGAETPVGIDGVSMAPTLTGLGVQRPRDYQIFEGHEIAAGISFGASASRWAIRRGDFKLIKFADGSFELYNLASDPYETNNIVAANASLKSQLEVIAMAEQVEQPTEYAVTYRTWIGANNASVTSKSSWVGNESPAANWSALVENASGAARTANVSSNVSFLGFGVKGTSGLQRVTVANNVTLTGRNEIRISGGGEIDLLGGNLSTVRWVDVRAGGILLGRGHVNGGIYNAGLVAASGGALWLHGGGVHSGAFTVAAGATLDFAGGAHVMNAGATMSGGGAVRVSGTASVTVAHGAQSTLRIETLAIDPAAKVDLKDNNLVLGAATLAAVEQMVADYRLQTTTPDALAGLTALGIAQAGASGFETFRGVSVGADDVIVMYTYAGDANLDGFISGDDLAAIDLNFATPGASGWYNGDFNHDGIISGDDYAAIDSNIVAQGAPFPTAAGGSLASPGSATAVPEPATILTMAGAVTAAMRSRRRTSLVRGLMRRKASDSRPPGG